MPKIELTKGKYAIVDEKDYRRLIELGKLWQATVRGRTAYAVTEFWDRKSKKKRLVYMHRWILDAPPHRYVDHKNGDGLDNRRRNLRLATCSQNSLNQRVHTQAVSGYKGVRRVQGGTGWAAYFNFAGEQTSVGSYETPELAACARDYHVIDKGLDKFAPLNFSEQPHTREEVEAGRTYHASEHPDIRFKANRWEAAVRENGRRRYVGRFKSLEAALAAQQLAAKPFARRMKRVVT